MCLVCVNSVCRDARDLCNAAGVAGARVCEPDGLAAVTGAESDVPAFSEGAGLG